LINYQSCIWSLVRIVEKKEKDMVEIEELESIEKTETKTEKPYWYKIIMIFSILPIFTWPYFFLWSVFFINSSVLSFGFNSLPIVFIVMLYFSSKIYNRHKIFSIVLLTLPLVCFCFLWLLSTGSFV